MRGGTRAIPLEPLMYGGEQEGGLRSGTLNVPGMVGFGEACRIAGEGLVVEGERMRRMRDRLEARLQARIAELQVNGDLARRLPNTSSLTFPGVEADALIFNLEQVMIGTGSACSSGAISPSHVLEAIGLRRNGAFGTVRVSLGRFTEDGDIDVAVEEMVDAFEAI